MDETYKRDRKTVEIHGCVLARQSVVFGYQVGFLGLRYIMSLLLWTDDFASLAYMEMYMAIAYIIRRFNLRLVDTTDRDMVWDDMVVPQFHGEFKVMTERRKE